MLACHARRVPLLDLLLPEHCVSCGRPDTPLCTSCLQALVKLRPPLCSRCGAPVAWPVERCRECAGRRLAFTSARSAIAYEGAAIRLVGAWKEGGRRRLAHEAAQLVTAAVERPCPDIVTYVPAVADRALWRGHDPAQDLAVALAEHWGLPFVPLLLRTGNRGRQRGLSLGARRLNVAGAFAAAGTCSRSVLLVDDVYTTGSTVSAAATALRHAGAARVDVVTLARALRGHA
jgi:predicted amidophosphoribosyltransferase